MADTTYTSIADLPPVMDNVYHIFHAGLCKRFTSAYQRIEQSLRDEARCSNNMDVKENCVFAIEDAKDHQEEIAKTFAEALIRSFSDFQKQIEMPEAAPKPVAPSKLDLSHLSLVDDDALQEKIDTQSMVASAMKSCEYLLIPITSGIVQAYSSARVKQLVHPLSPTRVGECLEQALTLGKFKGTARSIVFHLFREELFDNLAPLYKEVIDIFQTFSIELAMQQAQTRSLNITTLEVMPVDIGFGGSTAKPATKKRAQAVSDAQLQARTQRDSANPLQIDAERITQKQPGNTGSETGQQRNNPNGHPTNKNDSASPPYISAKETFIDIETWLRQNPVPDTLTFDAGFTSRLNYDGLSEHTEEDRTIISVSTKQLD
ncbi:MAG: DUF1631 domain-containing protein, partial [Pseudomonadales bacterium]|nr:DUF1631 domain-containing protein [Pseudomonadales bacterium]